MPKGKDANVKQSLRVRVIGMAVLMVLLTVGLMQGFKPSDQLEPPRDWEYASGESLRTNRIQADDWKKMSTIEPPEKRSGMPYLFLRGTLPADSEEWIYLYGSHESYRVTVNGNIVYDTISDNSLPTSARMAYFKLEASEQEKKVEIAIYMPFEKNITVFQSKTELPYSALWKLPYIDCIVPAAFLLLAVVCLANMYRGQKKRWGLLCSLICMAMIFFMEQMQGIALLFRLSMTCVLLVYTGCLIDYFLTIVGWNAAIEKLTAINLLYAISILILPYPQFLVIMLRMTIFLQIVNAAYIWYWTVHRKYPYDARTIFSIVAVSVVNLVYWYCISVGRLENCILAYAAVIFVLGVEFIVPIRMKQRVKETKVVSGVMRQREEKRVVPDCRGEEAEKVINLKDVRPHTHAWRLLQKSVEEKGIHGHGQRVAQYTYAICLAMGMSKERADRIAEAAILHDIGKAVISQDILTKKNLSETEFEMIKNHVQYGYYFLQQENDSFAALAANIAREHHERVDGSGYLGLKGNQIHLEARIVSVADVFDALTSARTYKDVWSFEEGARYILEHAGTYFDMDVVTAFDQAIDQVKTIYETNRAPQNTEATNGERRYRVWMF